MKKKKKERVEVPEYHATPSRRNENGEIVWPVPEDKMEAARSFILEWYAKFQAQARVGSVNDRGTEKTDKAHL